MKKLYEYVPVPKNSKIKINTEIKTIIYRHYVNSIVPRNHQNYQRAQKV